MSRPTGASIPTWAILLGAVAVVLCLAFAAKIGEQPAPDSTPSPATSTR